MYKMSKLVSVACIIVAIYVGTLYNIGLDTWLDKLKDLYYHNFPLSKDEKLFTTEELAAYNGETRSELYLAFMGTVYDVSKGSKHYGKDSPYHYFVGKDGSRAFATGDFKNESENKDHIIDLSCDELLAILKWKDAIREKYTLVGFLIGRYYNIYADDTEYHSMVRDKVERCLMKKQKSREEERKYPPCNIEWNAEKGTRVWCTKSSGGITREWVGFPRQMYSPGSEKPKCVCVKDPINTPDGKFKEYINCSNTSTSCEVKQT